LVGVASSTSYSGVARAAVEYSTVENICGCCCPLLIFALLESESKKLCERKKEWMGKGVFEEEGFFSRCKLFLPKCIAIVAITRRMGVRYKCSKNCIFGLEPLTVNL